MGLMALAAVAVNAIFFGAHRSESFVREEVNAAEDLRVILDRFARDARAGQAVTTGTCNHLVFTTYFNSSTQRTIDYTFSGTTLTRKIGTSAAVPLAINLTSAVFTAPGSSAPFCFPGGTITSVRLDLSITPKKSTQPVTLGTSVRMRNA
jgi:hypothetical protein